MTHDLRKDNFLSHRCSVVINDTNDMKIDICIWTSQFVKHAQICYFFFIMVNYRA